mgnify:FL=1|jgi:translation initiation factor RLI1
MPKKIALIDYDLCDPTKCSKDGYCKSADNCMRHLIEQEAPYEKPDPPMMCLGCGVCTIECPLGAVKMV